MARIGKISMSKGKTLEECYKIYISACAGKGLSEKTLKSYSAHFSALKPYLPDCLMKDLTKADIDAGILQMREKGLATNSIESYIKSFRAFLTWARMEGYTAVTIPAYRHEETVKDTYTDEELAVLLKRPNMKTCKFTEYRDWVIINLLVNSGMRAKSLRMIQNRDIDLSAATVTLRHTKTHKIQVLPLCSLMVSILREYMEIRGGEPSDPLFSDDRGNPLTESGMRDAVKFYNLSHGIKKTSIHMFRHTFARKYLLDCGGNALTLQKLLGHSTLEMTKHYCNIYNADLTNNYDSYSPLAQMSKKNKTDKPKIKMR